MSFNATWIAKLRTPALVSFLALAFGSAALAGPCECPNDTNRAGKRCGETSAFCRPGGDEPMCGAKDESDRAELFKKLCPKAYKRLRAIEEHGKSKSEGKPSS